MSRESDEDTPPPEGPVPTLVPRRPHRHRWRTNIEAATLALVVAVLFKYFLVEAYRIPSGSMQPTLMGWSDGRGGGVFDRVLVDKLSFHYRDPERFEVVVFRFPLDRSRNFVKRIVGMPGEELRIDRGDLFHHSGPKESWRILRRPRPVQREMLRRIETRGLWGFGASSETWQEAPRGIDARGPGRAVFPASALGIRDGYADGYPAPLANAIRAQGIDDGGNPVGDLRLEADVIADPDCAEVVFEIAEGLRRYRFVIPGPAAGQDACPRIVFLDRGDRPATVAELPQAWRLPAGRGVFVAAQNVDDLLELDLDGEVVLALEVSSAFDQRSRVVITTTGAGARFEDLAVLRDVFYTHEEGRAHVWRIPEGMYVVLGDNTRNSADSREWSRISLGLRGPDGADRVVRGEMRLDENPRLWRSEAAGEGALQGCFRDEFGELYWFAGDAAADHGTQPAPFVPRSAIVGRALLVFWPIHGSHGMRGPRWIR